KWTLFIAIPIFLGHLSVMAWSVSTGSSRRLSHIFVDCATHEKARIRHSISALFIAPICFDATIFGLILAQAIYQRMTGTSLVALFRLIVRDGTLYFMVIFSVNLVNVLLFKFAPPGIHSINASLTSIMPTILIARLVLNLKEAGHRLEVVHDGPDTRTMSVGTWIPSANVGHTWASPRKFTTGNKSQDFIGLRELSLPLQGIDAETELTPSTFAASDPTGEESGRHRDEVCVLEEARKYNKQQS
ncbi:hypothetical protein AX17_007473, partial [Amanita inopinata Kibby_2008]